jgi:hypothetical protein
VRESSLWIDVVEHAGLDEGINSGGAVAARIRACKGPVGSADGHPAQRSFGGVVGETDPAIVEEAREVGPAFEAIVNGLGGLARLREQAALLTQPI